MENNSTKKQVHVWGVALLLPLAVIIFGIWMIYSSEENREGQIAEANSAFLKEVEKTRNETLGQITSSEKKIIDTLTGVIDQKITEAVNYLGEKFTTRFDSLDKKVERMDAKSDANWAKYKSSLVSVRTIKSSPQKAEVSRSQRDAEKREFVRRHPDSFPDQVRDTTQPISSTHPTFLNPSSAIASNLSPTKPDTIVIIISVKGAVKYGDHPWLN